MLRPYSIYGHDGIIEKEVANDATSDALVKMAVSCSSGADFVAV
jgi:delta-aminolevulinic acid dehydratase/porphobilinogen synthase